MQTWTEKYEEIWQEIKPELESLAKWFANLLKTDYEELLFDDCYGFVIEKDKLGIAVWLVDGYVIEGVMGAGIDIRFFEGSKCIGSYIPKNYTPEVWTTDIEELKTRIREFPYEEALKLLSPYID